MTGWDELWSRRQPPMESQGSLLADLLAADGLTSEFARLSESAWRNGVRDLAAAVGIGPGMSVFEVGCGAGAFLHELCQLGCSVSGLDRSPALIAKAKEAMPTGTFSVADAATLERQPPADAVVSFGVFLYFASDAYADTVLDAMALKARHVVAVLDLPDLARREADLDYRERLAGGRAAYLARYAGLDHRYYDRERMSAALRARGLVGVHVEDQNIEGYGNAPFRFNAWGFVAPDGGERRGRGNSERA